MEEDKPTSQPEKVQLKKNENENSKEEKLRPERKKRPHWKKKKPEQSISTEEGSTAPPQNPLPPKKNVKKPKPPKSEQNTEGQGNQLQPNPPKIRKLKPPKSKTKTQQSEEKEAKDVPPASRLSQTDQKKARVQYVPKQAQQNFETGVDGEHISKDTGDKEWQRGVSQSSSQETKKSKKPRKPRHKKPVNKEDSNEEKEQDHSNKTQKRRDRAKSPSASQEKEESKEGKREKGAKPEGQKSKKRNAKNRYEAFLSKQEIEKGLKEGKYYKGKLRINAHNRSEAYATVEGLDMDVYINGVVARNRALEGDTVVVEILDKSQWKVFKGNKGDELLEEAMDEPEDEIVSTLDDSIEPVGGFQFDVKCDVSTLSKDSPSKDEELEEILQEFVEVNDGDSVIPLELEEVLKSLSLKEKGGKEEGKEEEKEVSLQPAGKVVAVTEQRPLGDLIGFVKPMNGKEVTPQDRWALFVPQDIKLPKFLIPLVQIPDFYKDPHQYDNKLVVAHFVKWGTASYYPLGKYEKLLGESGDIPVETEALLRANQVDFNDFSDDVMGSLPQGLFAIPEAELKRRRDLREVRIFSIDPPTAKDLDDALHITKLPNGSYEVGVHIADVSFFVLPNSPVDLEAARRATTVYLVQKAIPMLPPLLCENLCSLNPGVDRLAFSTIWELDSEGHVLKEWMGRTVIRSCSKLPYDVAQEVIEGKITSQWEDTGAQERFPHIGPVGNHKVQEVIDDILSLHKIAANLRKARYDSGAVTLNNVKLGFKLNEEGNPVETYPYRTREANHLVEEFMLLANLRVAHKISSVFPDRSLLRNHPPPNSRKLEGFTSFCKSLGFEVAVNSSKSLADTLARLKASLLPGEFQALQLLATKSMQLAKYFCTGQLEESQWHHFALNMSHYTHFTSPIRRYPDILVHRQLQAALLVENGDESLVGQLPSSVQLGDISEHCNEKKLNSRKAQDASAMLYLCLLLKEKPAILEAIVIGLGKKFITVVLPYLAEEKRIYLEDLAQLQDSNYDEATSVLSLYWKEGDESQKTQKVKLLQSLTVCAFTKPNKFPMELAVSLPSPKAL